MQHLHFNHLALITAAVFQWLLGALWFSPLLFFKPWQKAMKFDGKAKNATAGMVVSLISSLVLSFILDHFIIWSGASDFAHGAFIGFIAWLGFYVAPYYALSLFEDMPFKVVAINIGYWLVGMVVCGGILAIWQ
jgi:hypothetical protein